MGLDCEVLVLSERAGVLTTQVEVWGVCQTSCEDFGRGWKQTGNQTDDEECVENELIHPVARGRRASKTVDVWIQRGSRGATCTNLKEARMIVKETQM